jgi:hypothetical protein
MADQYQLTKFDERNNFSYLIRPVRINDQSLPELKATAGKVEKPARIFVIHDVNELTGIASDFQEDLVDGYLAILIGATGLPQSMFVWCTVDGVEQWKEINIGSGGGSTTGSLATAFIDGLLSSADFIKLQGIEVGANKYVHPATHTPAQIATDATHKFVADTDITNWNAAAIKAHAHGNQTIIDAITYADIQKWNAKMSPLGFTPENAANKGLAGGYVPLDANALIPAQFLPYEPGTGTISEVTWGIITGKPASAVADIDAAVTQKHTHVNKAVLDATQEAFTTALYTKLTTSTKVETSGINGNVKLDGVEKTIYVHPTFHNATMIVDDAYHRFVTDVDKTKWNNKQNALGFTPESVSNKGVANGYAGLDATGRIPTSMLPLNYKEIKVVNNLPDRDAITQFEGLIVLVKDASGDPTVASGWAEYVSDGSTWTKIGEGESLDMVLDWANLQGKPTSSVAGIDDAVAKRHSHANKGILDLTEQPFTTALKTKLDGISAGANKVSASTVNGNVKVDGAEVIVYTHPVNHAATVITEDATHRFTTDAEKASWSAKAETTAVSYTANGLMISTDKSKIDGIEAGANKYIHPTTHSIDIITETATSKIMTAAERTKLAAIEDGANKYIHPATHPADMITETLNLKIMTAAERAKLTGIEDGANNYTHPSTHPATIIVDDSTHRFVSDLEKQIWNAKATTDVVTIGSNGLMSADDKAKLNGISNNANKTAQSTMNGNVLVDGNEIRVYTHPDTHSADILTDGALNRLYSTAEKNKLAGISNGANKVEASVSNGNVKIDGVEFTVYTHPAAHAATMISLDSTHRFVSDVQISAWNGKQNALGYTPESIANKGIVNGYASLDSDGKIPSTQLPDSFKEMKVVATLAERDALQQFSGLRCHVIDATADVTVTSGWAEYLSDGVTWTKTAEMESLDVVLDWSNVQNKPLSTVSDIDDAVTRRHTHLNKAILDATEQAFTSVLKTKLDGIATGATFVQQSAANGKVSINGVDTIVYTHPALHPASIIADDATHRFVTDTEKAIWNAKAAVSDILVTKTTEISNPETIKVISGDYTSDPATYSEDYNLAAYGIVDFLWINVNGVCYCHSAKVTFDNVTNIMTIKGIQLLNTDQIVIAYNKRQA